MNMHACRNTQTRARAYATSHRAGGALEYAYATFIKRTVDLPHELCLHVVRLKWKRYRGMLPFITTYSLIH